MAGNNYKLNISVLSVQTPLHYYIAIVLILYLASYISQLSQLPTCSYYRFIHFH